MTTAIELRDVWKTFRGQVHALRGVSLQVDRGGIFCLLGPNGAGKSTLVKILMTVIHASRASGTMLSNPIGHKPTLRKVGYLPEHHRFPLFMTANQALHFYGGLQGMRRQNRRKKIEEMLTLVGMSAWRHRRIGTFSKGMQQRVGLAQALLHDPELILLDEPTDGVDPMGRRDIRDLLLHLRDQGRTILVNSHILAELEHICDRLAVVVKGRVTLQGTLAELTQQDRRWEVRMRGASLDWGDLKSDTTDKGTIIMLPNAQASDVQPVIDRVRAAGGEILGVQESQPSLEDLFMRAIALADEEDAGSPGAMRGRTT